MSVPPGKEGQPPCLQPRHTATPSTRVTDQRDRAAPLTCSQSRGEVAGRGAASRCSGNTSFSQA